MSKENVDKLSENKKTFLFTGLVCLSCSLVLSLCVWILKPFQESSFLIDQKKELLVAARLLDHSGRHLNREKQHTYATEKEILDLIQTRIRAMLVDETGNLRTFQELNIREKDYLAQGEKEGFYTLPQKIIYLLLPSQNKRGLEPEAFILPVQGRGLWGPIQGYLCLEADANTVRGATWYKHQETPGLGSFIAEPKWQKKLIGKKIFPVQAENNAPLGLYIIQGGVENKLNKSPKRFSSVDGVSGATLSGIGVTQAYQKVLEAYRIFLIKQRNQSK